MLFIVVLLMGASVAFFILYQEGFYFCLFFVGIFVLALMVYLYHRSRSDFQLIERLVDSLRYNDFTLVFSLKGKNATERRLRSAINDALADFRKQLTEHQERYKYYETLLDAVDSAMLVMDGDGGIHWMNRAAVQGLCGYHIHHVDELGVLNVELPQLLVQLNAGEVKVIKLNKEDFLQEMAVTITEYYTATGNFRLCNFKNIREVLEENEMEAWQKLVRVLTHEIMNSITPIISLSETLAAFPEENVDFESEYPKMLQGLRAIHRRSNGLLDFVNNYRKLSRLPQPVKASVKVSDLLDDIKKLMHKNGFEYLYQIEDESYALIIDRTQIEQVLINLLKNAEEACSEQKNPVIKIITRYRKENKCYSISVTDNGCGILPDVQNRIFVPFFTTKQKGSGIGLSLCKQIMSLHGGVISVKSEEGKGSVFTLKFFEK